PSGKKATPWSISGRPNGAPYVSLTRSSTITCFSISPVLDQCLVFISQLPTNLCLNAALAIRTTNKATAGIRLNFLFMSAAVALLVLDNLVHIATVHIVFVESFHLCNDG